MHIRLCICVANNDWWYLPIESKCICHHKKQQREGNHLLSCIILNKGCHLSKWVLSRTFTNVLLSAIFKIENLGYNGLPTESLYLRWNPRKKIFYFLRTEIHYTQTRVGLNIWWLYTSHMLWLLTCSTMPASR